MFPDSIPSAKLRTDRQLRASLPSVLALADVQALAAGGQVQQALFVAQASHGPAKEWNRGEDLAFAGEMLSWCGAVRKGEALAVRAWQTEPTSLHVRRVALELALARRDELAVWERGCAGVTPGAISADAVRFLSVLGRGWWFLGEKGKAELCWAAASVDPTGAELARCEKALAGLECSGQLESSIIDLVEKSPKLQPRLTFAVGNDLAASGQGKRALALLKAAAVDTEWSAFYLREAELWLIEGNPVNALAAIEKFESSSRLGDDKFRQAALRLKGQVWMASGNRGRAIDTFVQLGYEKPSSLGKEALPQGSVVSTNAGRMKQVFGELPSFDSLEDFQDFCTAKDWATLTDDWTLQDVCAAISNGWLVAWQEGPLEVVIPQKVETTLGSVFTTAGTVRLWCPPQQIANQTARRRVTVVWPLGESVPRDLAQSGKAEAYQWLAKLRIALEHGELGRGWQLLREVEGAAGLSSLLDEAKGRVAEAANASYPMSPWISTVRSQSEKAKRFFSRKLNAAVASKDVNKVQSVLMRQFEWQRKLRSSWNLAAWLTLLNQLLAVAHRSQQVPAVLAFFEDRWRLRGDAMSLADAVDAFLVVGDRDAINRLLVTAKGQVEVAAVTKLLTAKLDYLTGHTNEALTVIENIDASKIQHERWIELALELAMGLGKAELAAGFAQSGLQIASHRSDWWCLVAEHEGGIDLENGTRRIWHQALRTRSGDATLYQLALKAARRAGPLVWEDMILDDWDALAPQHPFLLLEKAKTAYEKHRIPRTRELLADVIKHAETFAEGTAFLAKTHSDEGDAQTAAGMLLDAWRADPDSIPVWQELLKMATKATIRQELLAEAFQKIHDGKAGDALFEAWRGASDGQIGYPQLLARLALARPDLPSVAVHATRALVAAKKDDAAAELIRQAVNLHFLNGDVWRQRAELQDIAARAQSAESALFWQQAALLGRDSEAWIKVAAWAETIADKSTVSRAALAASAASNGCCSTTWERLGDLAQQRGDAATGMRYLANALLREPLQSGLWRKMFKQSETAGLSDSPEQVSDWLCQLFPAKLEMWLAAARVNLFRSNERKFFQALQKARELAPKSVDTFALECQWYAKENEFQKAQEACLQSVYGHRLDEMPAALQARYAWVESVRGDLGAAIKQMRQVLEKFPEYEWGRKEMLGWLSATGQQQEAEAILSRTNLEPKTLRQARDEWNAEKLEPLGEVVTIYEKLRVFDTHLQNRRVDEAAKLLDEMIMESPGPLVTARSVTLAVAVSDKQRVEEALDTLIATATDERYSLDLAVDGYEKMFGRPRMLNYLEKKCRDLDGVRHPGVLACWVRKLNENSWKGLPNRILEVLETRSDAALAVTEYLQQMAETGRKLRASRRMFEPEIKVLDQSLDSLASHKGAWLQARPDTWLAMAAAWNALGRHAKAWRWTQKQQPASLTADMLEQLMLAAQGTGKHKQALGFAEQGLALPTGKALPRFLVWPALVAVLSKNFAQGEIFLNEVAGSMPEDLRTTHRLTKTLSRALQSSERPSFSESMQNQFTEFWQSNRSISPKWAWSKGLRLLASKCLSPMPILWGFWSHNKPWIRAALLVSSLVVGFLVILEFKAPKLLPWHRNAPVVAPITEK